MTIFKEYYQVLVQAVQEDDLATLQSCCNRLEFPFHSYFHRNTLDLCIKYDKRDLLVQLQSYCPHNDFNWLPYNCMNIAEYGSVDMMKLAIKQGCTLYPVTVYIAAREGQVDMVKYLLTEHFLFSTLSNDHQFQLMKYVVLDIIRDKQGEMFQWCWDHGCKFPNDPYNQTLAAILNIPSKHLHVRSTSDCSNWWRKFLPKLVLDSNHTYLHKRQQQSVNFDEYLATINSTLNKVVQPPELHSLVFQCL